MTPVALATQTLSLADLAGGVMVLAIFAAALLIVGGLLELAGADVCDRIARRIFR